GEVTVRLRSKGQDAVDSKSADFVGLRSGEMLCLTLGKDAIWGLDRALASGLNRARKGHVAHLAQVDRLPRRWFGYDAVDVVILTTGDKAFLEAWANDADRKASCEALCEWVRRGGRLVVSVGRNPDLLEKLPELAVLLPVRKITRATSANEMR